jgi:hypothetical protein
MIAKEFIPDMGTRSFAIMKGAGGAGSAGLRGRVWLYARRPGGGFS